MPRTSLRVRVGWFHTVLITHPPNGKPALWCFIVFLRTRVKVALVFYSDRCIDHVFLSKNKYAKLIETCHSLPSRLVHCIMTVQRSYFPMGDKVGSVTYIDGFRGSRRLSTPFCSLVGDNCLFYLTYVENAIISAKVGIVEFSGYLGEIKSDSHRGLDL